MIWTKKFWQGAGERAIKTAAQAGLLAIGAEQLNVFDNFDVLTVAGFAAGGAILSLLTSIGNADFVAGDLPDVVLVHENTP